jgi:hypothetical protein
VVVQSAIPVLAEGGAPTGAGLFRNGQLDEALAKQILSNASVLSRW